MEHENKTRQQMIEELKEMRQRLTSFEERSSHHSKLEEALRKSEERFRTVFENAPYSISVNSLRDNSIIAVNSAFEKNTGYSASEVLGKNLLELGVLIHPVDYQRLQDVLAQKGRIDNEPLETRNRNGEIRHILFSTASVDLHGEPSYITMTADVTEERRAVEALRLSERKFSDIFNLSPDFMGISRVSNGRLLEVNRGFAEGTGWSREEAIGRTALELNLWDEPQQRKKATKKMNQEGKLTNFDFVYRTKAGSKRHGLISMTPIRIQSNDFLCFAVRDITERKRTEEALKESETKFRVLADSSSNGIFLIQGTKFIYVNQAFGSITGYAMDDLINMNFWNVVHPDFRELVRERALGRLRGESPPSRYEIKFLTKNGQTRWIDYSASIIELDNKPTIIGSAFDITERIRAKEALRDSELTYQTIFETTGTTMLIVEEDMTISLANDGFESLTGYKREEVEGKRKWTEFVKKSDLEKMVTQHQLRRADSGIAKRGYEFRLVLRDGHLRNIFLTVDIIPGTKRSVASLMDITDRKQAEEALRESEKKYRQLFMNAPAAIYEVDYRNLCFISFNEIVPTLTGYSRQDLMQMDPRDLFTEESQKTYLERMRLIKEGSAVSASQEYEIRKKDGGILWVSTNIDFVIEDGLSVGARIVAHDITERKQAEEALRESQQQLSDIIQFLPDATLVIDKEGKVIAWNRAIEKATGVKAEDMLGKGNYEYALPFYGERRPILIDLALHPDREMEKQYTSIQRIGDILLGESFTPNLSPGDIHLSATASVLRNSKGEIIAAIECIRDNSERRRLEERLNRAEKMEGLGRMAGGVAHDLNNVLGVLVGYSELLAEKLPAESPLKRYADNIHQSSLRGGAIIQDLLTLARRGVTVSEVVDVNSVVFNYLRTLEFEKMKSYHPKVKIWTDLSDGLLNIKGSPVHLGKTIMNLVSNAVEAIADQGEVTIRTENRYLDSPLCGYDEMQEGDYVVLTVSDTGSGISTNDIRKIFEPFYTKKVMGRSGTGLGLAVVWGTVKDHNGYIDVQSEEGKGSTFTLYFPATREDLAKVQEAISIDAYMGRGESILIVDDVEAQREVAMSMLGRLGYQVKAVSSGEKAIEYLKNGKADLVILDMIMDPGIDGMETYRRILEINPEQKAVIVSGFSESDRVRKAQEMGTGAFVQKPYILEKIGLAIRKELDRK